MLTGPARSMAGITGGGQSAAHQSTAPGYVAHMGHECHIISVRNYSAITYTEETQLSEEKAVCTKKIYAFCLEL